LSPERKLYAEEWSIKFDDIGTLLETHGVSSPEDYFRNFFTLSGYFTNGIQRRAPSELFLSETTIRWHLESEKVESNAAVVMKELRALEEVRTLVFRASWREDLRVIGYVPNLGRGVLIQAGYEQGAGDEAPPSQPDGPARTGGKRA
jgi:hypothetical protein